MLYTCVYCVSQYDFIVSKFLTITTTYCTPLIFTTNDLVHEFMVADKMVSKRSETITRFTSIVTSSCPLEKKCISLKTPEKRELNSLNN